MNRHEAIAINGVIYSCIAMRHLLASVCGPTVPVPTQDALAMLADRAHRALGVGLDGGVVKKLWSDHAEFVKYAIDLKRKANS